MALKIFLFVGIVITPIVLVWMVSVAMRVIEETNSNLYKLRFDLDEKNREVRARDGRIKNLMGQLAQMERERKEFEEKEAELKKIKSDILCLENTLAEQRKASQQLKQRIEEDKIKLQLLNEKIKGNVETLASFVEGKEFEEFRKSVHLDRIVREYEDEIKALRSKNLELQKRIGDG
jgi:septal ring factor EnvC (AmiA/AmiB activator)